MSDPRIEAAALEDAADIIWMRANSESGACDADRRTDSYRVAEGVAHEVIGAYLAAADKAATITTVEELDALPMGTVVVSPGYAHAIGGPVAFQRLYDGLWHRGGRASDTHPEAFLPARVIHFGGSHV